MSKAAYPGRVLTNARGMDEQNKVVLSRDREEDDLISEATPFQAVRGTVLHLKGNVCGPFQPSGR